MQHKWAWPFNEPVNAERMGLKDYHTVIQHPMVCTFSCAARTGAQQLPASARPARYSVLRTIPLWVSRLASVVV